jgi:hypothetical protein
MSNHYDVKMARAIIADASMREAYKQSVPMYAPDDSIMISQAMYARGQYNRKHRRVQA